MTELFGYLSGVLIILAFIPYIRDIFLHKTKPERGSWLIWSILGYIAFFSQLAEGASYSLFLVGIQALGDTLVLALAVRYGIGGLVRRDILGLLGAGVSLVFWYFTQEPAIALFLVIFIDGIGGILTIIKTFEIPSTETVSSWFLTSLSGFFAALAVGSLNPILLAFPIYTCLVTLAIAIAEMVSSRRSKTVLAK